MTCTKVGRRGVTVGTCKKGETAGGWVGEKIPNSKSWGLVEVDGLFLVKKKNSQERKGEGLPADFTAGPSETCAPSPTVLTPPCPQQSKG